MSDNGTQSSTNQPLRWGEVMKAELKADIQRVASEVATLKEVAVTHKALFFWAAGFVVTICATAVGLGAWAAKGAAAAANEAKAGVVEVQKDVRSLYRVILSNKPAARLEKPPTMAAPAALGVQP